VQHPSALRILDEVLAAMVGVRAISLAEAESYRRRAESMTIPAIVDFAARLASTAPWSEGESGEAYTAINRPSAVGSPFLRDYVGHAGRRESVPLHAALAEPIGINPHGRPWPSA